MQHQLEDIFDKQKKKPFQGPRDVSVGECSINWEVSMDSTNTFAYHLNQSWWLLLIHTSSCRLVKISRNDAGSGLRRPKPDVL